MTSATPVGADARPARSDMALPTREEIEAAVAPYIVGRMPADDAAWSQATAKVRRRESLRFLKRQVSRWVPGMAQARPQSLVSDHYETHWARFPWPRTWDPATDEKPVPCTWDDEGLFIRRYGIKRAHLLVLQKMLAALKPESALEVGFGNGINLFVLSAAFPEISWNGVELTSAGLAMARSVQSEPELPKVLQDFNPGTVESSTAHKSLKIQQGDASALPFADNSFDVVYTVLALEQMQPIRDQALREIRRVARKYAIMVEPFAEANQSWTQRCYLRSRGYLDLSVDALPSFGLEPVVTFSNVPDRITLGASVTLARVLP